MKNILVSFLILDLDWNSSYTTMIQFVEVYVINHSKKRSSD